MTRTEIVESPIAARVRGALDGRTQTWLAGKTGLNIRTLSFWMRGRNQPSVESVAVVAQALKVSPGWLAFGEVRDPGEALTSLLEEWATMQPSSLMSRRRAAQLVAEALGVEP